MMNWTRILTTALLILSSISINAQDAEINEDWLNTDKEGAFQIVA